MHVIRREMPVFAVFRQRALAEDRISTLPPPSDRWPRANPSTAQRRANLSSEHRTRLGARAASTSPGLGT